MNFLKTTSVQVPAMDDAREVHTAIAEIQFLLDLSLIIEHLLLAHFV